MRIGILCLWSYMLRVISYMGNQGVHLEKKTGLLGNSFEIFWMTSSYKRERNIIWEEKTSLLDSFLVLDLSSDKSISPNTREKESKPTPMCYETETEQKAINHN